MRALRGWIGIILFAALVGVGAAALATDGSSEDDATAWMESQLTGIELVESLQLPQFEDPNPPDDVCRWIGELPGDRWYCIDSALPQSDNQDYVEYLYIFSRRVAGEMVSLEEARGLGLELPPSD
jgi:hypothetical protein